jgi:hypothetical protein
VKVPQYNESIRKRAEAVKRARAERAGNERLLNAVFEGAIFHHSWGYEQTNCDYYQVVARKGRTVHLREIAGRTIEGSEGYMSDTRKPVKDHFTSDKILKKRLQFTGDGRPYISFEFGWCDLWDGTANYCSWYA